jgi:hypothetical protein
MNVSLSRNNIMASTIIGRFYLKKTSNGNLIGEFSNDHSNDISTESCDLRGIADGSYPGAYYSTWQEGGKPLFANLTIAQQPEGNNRLFSLEWSRDGACIFQGAGMLCDNILVGDYRSV